MSAIRSSFIECATERDITQDAQGTSNSLLLLSFLLLLFPSRPHTLPLSHPLFPSLYFLFYCPAQSLVSCAGSLAIVDSANSRILLAVEGIPEYMLLAKLALTLNQYLFGGSLLNLAPVEKMLQCGADQVRQVATCPCPCFYNSLCLCIPPSLDLTEIPMSFVVSECHRISPPLSRWLWRCSLSLNCLCGHRWMACWICSTFLQTNSVCSIYSAQI